MVYARPRGRGAAKEVYRAGGLQKRGRARLAREGGVGGKIVQGGRGQGEVGKCHLDKAWRHLVATHTFSRTRQGLEGDSCKQLFALQAAPVAQGKSKNSCYIGRTSTLSSANKSDIQQNYSVLNEC